MVVAIGDSFASGEGASTDAGVDYYKETDNDGGGVKGVYNDTGYDWLYGNACHRSKWSWPRMAKTGFAVNETMGQRQDRWDPTLDLQFHACSGAVTTNVRVGYNAKFREVPQLDQGFIDENTTQVMLSIGGNDAGFTKVVTACIQSIGVGNPDCQDKVLDGDTRLLRDAGPADVETKVIPNVELVLREIALKAPNAKILLVGYPKLISNNGGCLGGTVVVNVGGLWIPVNVGVSPTETAWLASSVEFLSAKYLEMTTRLSAELGRPIVFADPVPRFEGHGVCGSPAWLNAIILTRTAGEPEMLGGLFSSLRISQQSFHPTKEGAAQYAALISEVLSHNP
jgi:hypothetical protein